MEQPDKALTTELDKELAEHKAKIVAMAMQRERRSCTMDQQLMGEKELPGVLRCLARVFDFKNGCMLDKPREAAVKPVGAVSKLEAPKLREVPVVPPELEPTLKKQQQQPTQSKPTETNRYGQEQQQSFGLNVASNMIRVNTKPVRQPQHASSARVSRRPIIVVPNEFISLVTLHNVKTLLEDLRFVPPSLMRRSDKVFPDEVTILHSYRGKEQEYCAIDNVTRLSQQDWQQVVAVFVFNPHTQFIGWPFHGEPAAICRHFCAFHLHFKGQAILRDLESLWLNMLSLPQNERHLDQHILKEFWRKLDEHMAKNDRQMDLGKQK